MIKIGPYSLPSVAVLAPMAGTTDLPFRQLCREFGAGLAVAEMLISDRQLWHTRKSHLRLAQAEGDINAVQIAGADPEMMADAARGCESLGADIIDINMGCPAKKVCKKAAGSALLQDPELVEQILCAVVSAVSVPVTLKIRTGASPDQRNGVEIAKLAQDCGIASLAVHGRTRACRFKGSAEYDTIATIKQAVSIPVLANGDIDSPQKAAQVLAQTGADGVMIGRGAQGRPWLFREINEYLATGAVSTHVSLEEVERTLLRHLSELHQFYGEYQGLRIARKHCAWYLQHLGDYAEFRSLFNTLDSAHGQRDAVQQFFEQHAQTLQEAAA